MEGAFLPIATRSGRIRTAWLPNMPRVPDQLLDSVFFLYKTEEDAEQGVNDGGTGFLVGMYALDNDRYWHLYAVTNHHVIASSRVLRFNTKGGGHEIFITSEDEWFTHPEGDDVVMMEVSSGDIEHCEVEFINCFDFMEEYEQKSENLGPGDEVFMVGRFRGFEGVNVNRPVVRLGNIAAMPDEKHPIPVKGRLPQVGFVMEMRSQSGFSGSPVFAFIRAGDDRMDGFKQSEFTGPYLIGIDFGQINWLDPVLDETGEHPIPEGHQVTVHTGFSGVVPVNRILGIMMSEKLKQRRCELDAGLNEYLGQNSPSDGGKRLFSVRKGKVWKKDGK